MLRRKPWKVMITALLFFPSGCSVGSNGEPRTEPSWPKRVLITNDDGIDSRATIELAKAFAEHSETYLVVPMEDQSSSTNFATSVRTRRFEVEKRDLGTGVTTWAVDGYPADCVFFAIAGPLRESLPDLVISGVNTGSNLADAWMGSGTIGAARVATYYGVPAIAVSGTTTRILRRWRPSSVGWSNWPEANWPGDYALRST